VTDDLNAGLVLRPAAAGLLEAAAGMGSWECAAGLIRLSAEAAALHGLPPVPHTEPLETWLARLHPEDRVPARGAFAAALAAPVPLRGEWRLGVGAGEWSWVELRGGAPRPLAEAPPLLFGVLLDIAPRKAREAVTLLGLREMEHRAKNALATAQALVRLTRAEDPRAFVRAVEQRLAALGRAHAQLSAAPGGEGVSLRGIARAELDPYGREEARRLHGPALVLPPAAVQPLCMVLHELATNAAKYGALSRPGGMVTLRWRQRRGGGLLLAWRETGGPPVDAPPASHGFGLTMLDALIREQLGGALRVGWRTEGLRLVLCLPAACLGAEPRAAV
jgi:two-component sensor histidine kinase